MPIRDRSCTIGLEVTCGTPVAPRARVRVLALFLLTLSSVASANPCVAFDGDPTLPACLSWLEAPHHTLDLSGALGVTASGTSSGALVTESARGDLGYTLGIGRDIDEYEI